jgi:hypothetical protein
MSNLSYRLYDRNGRRISATNLKSAYRADFILKNKVVYSLDFPARYKKSSKEDDIDLFLTVYYEEIEAQKEITRLKIQEANRKRKELSEYKKILKEKQQELTRQKKIEKLLEKDFEALLKEEERLEKIEEKRREKEKEIQEKKDYEILSEREEALIKEEKRKLRASKAKLSRSVQGRIRLYLKEHLIDKLKFWDQTKEDDFVKVLERMYGKEVRSLKERNDEANFKKFTKRVIDSLETFDIREVPTAEEFMRSILKSIDTKEKIEKKNLDYILDHDEEEEIDYKYELVNTDVKFYYSKSSNFNFATKRFIYNFDTQLSISPFLNRQRKYEYSDDVNDIYDNLREIFISEISSLFDKNEIALGTQFQIRVFIPQFDGESNLITNYVGGNGTPKNKQGYGISFSSIPFALETVDTYIESLFDLMKERIANYLDRNIGTVQGQFITGFMIVTGV